VREGEGRMLTLNMIGLRDEVSKLVYSELEGTGVPMVIKECIIDSSISLFQECLNEQNNYKGCRK
jgi:hypothetical protein